MNLKKVGYIIYSMFFVIGLLLSAVSCSSGPAGISTYNVGITYFPRTYNPFLAVASRTDHCALNLVYESLMIQDLATGDYLPVLAKSWEWDSADLSWTFHLDGRAKFSDGTAVTADDVKFSFDTAFDVAGQWSAAKASTESITVVNDRTVKFTLTAPNAYYLELLLGCYIVPEAEWTGVDVMTDANEDPLGSGPYLWTEMETNEYALFEKNPNYWRGAPKVDRVIERYFGTQEAMVLALRTGDIDAIGGLYLMQAVPEFIQNPDTEVGFSSLNGCDMLLLNLRKEPFDIKEVRQAMDVALDRQAIVYQAADGYGQLPLQVPLGHGFPVTNEAVSWPYSEMTQAERIAEANDILDDVLGMSTIAAGVEGIRTYNGEKVSIDPFWWNSRGVAAAGEAEIIVNNMKDIGIEAVSTPISFVTAYRNIMRNAGDPEKLDMWGAFIIQPSTSITFSGFLKGWAKPEPAPLAEGGVWDPVLNGLSEAAGWTNKTIQDKCALVALETDPVARLALEYEIQELFAEEVPQINLFSNKNMVSVHRTDKFEGWLTEYKGAIGATYIGMPLSAHQVYQLSPIQ